MQETLATSTEPTERFSNRVENYVKYRPGYPAAVIEYLQQQFGLNNGSYIADIGSGTGIFTKLLLDKGFKVYAVEPNEPMKQAAEKELQAYKNFTSVAGTAEHTNLLAGSVDLITSATAFHWFDTPQAKTEFKRILKPEGAAALTWNVRKPDADDFAIAYDRLLLKYTTDYKQVKERTLNGERLVEFFDEGKFESLSFANQQEFDEDGLIGRSLSSSFVPLPDTEDGKAFLKDLKEIFNKYKVNDKVYFNYDTLLYVGKV